MKCNQFATRRCQKLVIARVVGTSAGAIARGVVNAAARNGAEQFARVKFGKQGDFEWEQMAGAAVSGGLMGPLSVGIGGKMGASLSGGGTRTAYLAMGTGAAGLAGDAVTQWGAMSAGRQEGFNLGQSLTAFAGGALGAALGQAVYDKTCFRAGTPLVCEAGHKKVEDLRVGDRLTARSEFDPDGPIEYKAIEEVFVRRGLILEVTVAGQTIGTTAEHPFYVFERGWTPAGELQVSDLLATADGRYLPVEKLHHTGNLETVYNFRVADHHTYFVADQDWGFEVWVHNTYSTTPRVNGRPVTREQRWLDLATRSFSYLPKAVRKFIVKTQGVGVKDQFGLTLAHRPKMSNAQGFDYADALPSLVADHHGIQHRYLKERRTGTTISMPVSGPVGTGKLSLPRPGSLPS